MDDPFFQELQNEKRLLGEEKELERKEFSGAKKKAGFRVIETDWFQEGILKVTALLPSPFEKPFWLHPGSPVFLTGEDWESKGTIVSISPKEINLHLRIFEESIPPEDSFFSLQAWYSEITYELLEDTVQSLLQNPNSSTSLILRELLGMRKVSPLEEPRSEEKDGIESEFSPWERLQKILEKKAFAIVYGPPGTGKTTLLLQAIDNWTKEKKSILALAPNNYAVDNLVEKGIEIGLNPLRLGQISRVREAVLPFTLEERMAKASETKLLEQWRKDWKKLKKRASTWKRNFTAEDRKERSELRKEASSLMRSIQETEKILRKKILEESDFIASTFLGASRVQEIKSFDIVLIDEATQAWDSSCYFAASLGKQIVIVGDPKQLPSFQRVSSHRKKSFLEKAIEANQTEAVVFLETQYRMPENFMDFSSKTFYENLVVTKKANASKRVLSQFFSESLVFIDTSGYDAEEVFSEESQSFCNPVEISFLLWLSKQENFAEEAAFLSPYSDQVNSLQKRILPSQAKPSWQFQTIDSFQGRESSGVFLSLVRSNPMGEIGFLADPRRGNVALTRAKDFFLLVGDGSTLAHHPFWESYMEYVKNRGEIRSIFEFDWEWNG